MDKKIKSAFGEIKAEQELKTSTKYYLYKKYNAPEKKIQPNFLKTVLALSLITLVIATGTSIFTYSIPVSAISLDGSSASIELGVNRFDKVITVTCFGENKLTEKSELKNMNYIEAVEAMLKDIEKNDSAMLTVSCKNAEKQREITDAINSCKANGAAVACHQGNGSISHEAHSHGLSTGKYNAYLTLKKLVPEITVEEIKNLSMKEIYERINALSAESPTEITNQRADCNQSQSHSGNGHHAKHGN